MDKLRLGDLVIVTVREPYENKKISGIIIKGPYPAVFTIEDGITIFSEESLAVDLMCDGRLYTKVKCDYLKKINIEH